MSLSVTTVEKRRSPLQLVRSTMQPTPVLPVCCPKIRQQEGNRYGMWTFALFAALVLFYVAGRCGSQQVQPQSNELRSASTDPLGSRAPMAAGRKATKAVEGREEAEEKRRTAQGRAVERRLKQKAAAEKAQKASAERKAAVEKAAAAEKAVMEKAAAERAAAEKAAVEKAAAEKAAAERAAAERAAAGPGREERKAALCADSHPTCQFWANNGECTSNPDFMQKRCRISCGLCDNAQPLANEHGGATASSVNNEQNLTQLAQGSSWDEASAVLDAASSESKHEGSATACLDRHMACRSWRDRGECTKNPSFMLKECRAACGACSLSSRQSKA